MRLLNVLLLFLLSSPVLAENRVLELDGQGSYVELPGQIFNGLEAATVEAWVKWEDWAYFSQFFAFGTDGEWRAMCHLSPDTLPPVFTQTSPVVFG